MEKTTALQSEKKAYAKLELVNVAITASFRCIRSSNGTIFGGPVLAASRRFITRQIPRFQRTNPRKRVSVLGSRTVNTPVRPSRRIHSEEKVPVDAWHVR